MSDLPCDHCEFCEAAPTQRVRIQSFGDADYERFACPAHVEHVRRLVALDWWGRTDRFYFEPVEGT